MNRITFTATVELNSDCEHLTDEELMRYSKFQLEKDAVLTVHEITLKGETQ